MRGRRTNTTTSPTPPRTMNKRALALVHVDAVVEVGEVGQIVDARPLDRPAGTEAVAHRLEERAVGEDLRMTVHAGLGRRNARERRLFHRRVTVAAVDAVAGDVAFVAELDRLLARGARFGHPWRAVHFGEQTEETRQEEHGAEDADPSNRVGAAMKDLRHRRGTTRDV